MKQSGVATVGVLTVRYNQPPPGGGANNCKGLTTTVFPQRLQQPRGAVLTVTTTSQGHSNGSSVAVAGVGGIFNRLQNSNVIQVRRVLPPQRQKIQPSTFPTGHGHVSSSESSDELQTAPGRNGGGTNNTPNKKRGILRGFDNEDEGGGDIIDMESESVDISVVRRDDDDDEELLMDLAGDDDDDVEDGDEEGNRQEKTAMEMNGDGDPVLLRSVVETEVLNRHKTIINDWDGTKGHMCQICHETFLGESGLEHHRNRRIHHILFSCRYCKRDLSFFNKCRLLQHLRNHHRVTPTVSGLQNSVMIRLLPESEYLYFKYEDCTSSSDEDGKEKEGSGGSGHSASSSPPKRLKPSKFRKIPRSSLFDEDPDSPDNSPAPSVTKQVITSPRPPQIPALSASPSAPITNTASSSGMITSAVNNSTTAIKAVETGAIKYAGNGTSGDKNKRSDQVTVIKSTGNTTSVILPSPAVNLKISSDTGLPPAPVLKKVSASPSSSETPQIRIRSLSQITGDHNDDEENQVGEKNDQSQSVVQQQRQYQPQQIVAVVSATATLTNSDNPVVTTTSTQPTANSTHVIVAQSAIEKAYRCYKCEKDFSSGSELFQHLKEAEQAGLSSKSLHRCPKDDIPSWSQCQYVFHTKVFHEKIFPFMCPGCGTETSDYNSLVAHVTKDCFYLFQRARYMCAASAQKCSFVDRKSVKTEPEIVDHLKKEHSRSVLQCLECPQGFATENWLLKHLSDAHKINFDESKQGTAEREALINKATRPLIQCLPCNILFPNVSTFLQHVYLNFHTHILLTRMYECQSCMQVFESKDDIINHRKQNEKCQRTKVFEAKIFGAAAGSEVAAKPVSTQLSVTPTPIKIIANPIVTQSKPIQVQQGHIQIKQQPTSNLRVQPVTSPVITLIATPNSNGSVSVSQSQPQRSQQHTIIQLKQISNTPPTTSTSSVTSSSSTTSPPSFQQNPSQPVQSAKRMDLNRIVHKNTFFDELLACQFCERLVLYSSLRKHEDQCCGLSSVSPGFCLTCRKNFGDRKRLARHGIVHFKEGLPICLYCNNRHMRPTHPKSAIPTPHENLYALKKHIYSNHTSKPIQYPFQCPICDTICKEKRAVEFHIKNHHFQYKVTEGEPDPLPIPTSPDDLSKMVKVRRKGSDPRKKVGKQMEVYYCPVCKNREFAQENGLARHFKLVHQKNPRTLNLSRLKKPSTARRFVLKDGACSPPHLVPQKPLLRSAVVDNKAKIGLNTKAMITGNRILRSTAGGTTAANSTVTVASSSSSTSFTSRFSSNIALRKRVAASSNTLNKKPPVTVAKPAAPKPRSSTDSSSTSTHRDIRPPSNFLQTRSSKCVRKRDGTIICHKCPNFSCTTEDEFCEHVKWKHIWSEEELEKLQYGNKAGMEEPSEYWCPECNSKFVAKPTLVKHLKIVHDYISSVEDYMLKIGYEGKKPVRPNQCDVCYYQCADEREFQQHIRTHGMAFLRAQRQQRQLSMAK